MALLIKVWLIKKRVFFIAFFWRDNLNRWLSKLCCELKSCKLCLPRKRGFAKKSNRKWQLHWKQDSCKFNEFTVSSCFEKLYFFKWHFFLVDGVKFWKAGWGGQHWKIWLIWKILFVLQKLLWSIRVVITRPKLQEGVAVILLSE